MDAAFYQSLQLATKVVPTGQAVRFSFSKFGRWL
jgi:hypothetical protein